MRSPLTTRDFLGLLAAAVIALGAACSSGTEPGGEPTLTRVGGDEQQGLIQTQLGTPLAVRVTDAGGAPVAGVTVTWTVTTGGGSVSPTSSTTDATGVATTIWTLGSLPGEQRVTASMAGGVSTTFTANANSVSACASPVTLGLGGMCLASAAQLASLNVVAGDSPSEFAVIPFNDAGFTRTPTQVDATATGAISVTGPPMPTVIPGQDPGMQGSNSLLAQDYGFERRLRQRERSTLGPLVNGGRGVGSGPAAAFNVVPAPPVFAIGDQMTLNTRSSGDCTSPPVMKTAIVRAQSANAIVVEDTQNPAGFTSADYDEILANFENVVYPSNINAFGGHTDIDQNQRILIFYTIEVNRLTSAGSTSFVGGFFFSRDLFPKSGSETTPSGKSLSGCASSNYAEMFYMLAPDPQGCFSSSGACPGPTQNQRTVDFVKTTTAGTIAHEYQHLINASRRLRITPNAAFPEAVWLDEGLSHIAEELAYYRATGFQPRQNINIDGVRSAEQSFNTYQNANMGRYNQYVRRTNTHSPYGETSQSGSSVPPDWDDLETRGAIWAFLRWAADHRGSSDGDTWQRLVRDATLAGADNLRAVFGTSIGSRFREWAGATYLDDAPGMPEAEFTFRQPSWNFRSILAAYTSNSGSFPLQVFVLSPSSTTFNLVDGGAAYLRFGVAANSTANVSVKTVGGGQLPSGASAWVVRTK